MPVSKKQVFVHEPMEPYVLPDYLGFRYFSRGAQVSYGMWVKNDIVGFEVQVQRLRGYDKAQLVLSALPEVYLRVGFTPNELRELAARLLDAAHDIDVHPASELTKEAA